MNFTLGIEVTRACNFRCRHCFVDAGPRGLAEPTAGFLEELIRQASVCGVDNIGWSGGEPLLRRELPQLTALATSLGIRVGLATNGYLATPERLAALQQAGLEVVQVSLDGPDAERAVRYRRGPKQHFERAVAAVRASVELGLQTYLCALLAPEAIGEVEEMIELTQALRADGLRYTMWAPVGRAAGERYDEASWRGPAMQHFLAVVGHRRITGETPRVLIDCPTGPLPWSRRFGCLAGREIAYVTAQGDLYPCTALMFPAYRVGNVRERPFAELFNDGRMLKVLREVARWPVQGSCSTCSMVASCRGGCPGRTVAEFGRLQWGTHRRAMPVCLYEIGAYESGGPNAQGAKQGRRASAPETRRAKTRRAETRRRGP